MIAGRVSIVIPSCNEIFLAKTINDLLAKVEGDIEIIAVLDNWWLDSPIVNAKVNYLHFGTKRGMRFGINQGVAIATGEYIMKLDAHCMLDQGFDTKLKADCEKNWIVIPRRLRLDAEHWCIEESSKNKPPIDYEYISSPGSYGAKGNKWDEHTLQRIDKPEYLIDDDMTFQGSCYFMYKDYFNELGGLSEVGYGTFVRESQEIGLKCWLTGGRVVVNKKTWYAHLHKGPTYGRMYFIDKREVEAGNIYCDDYWFNNRLPNAVHDLAWLIEKFSPVPSWTPELIEQVRKK